MTLLALMGAWDSLNPCHAVLKPIPPCTPLGIGLIELNITPTLRLLRLIEEVSFQFSPGQIEC